MKRNKNRELCLAFSVRKMLEICTGSLADCLAAEKGGAKRVELNSALALGGLTPSLATLQAVKK